MSLLNAVAGMFQGVRDASNVLDNKENVERTMARLSVDAERAYTAQKVSIVVGLGGIALGCLAVSCFAAGEEKMGTVLICADTALLISSYNTYKASENFRTQLGEDMLELMVMTAKGQEVPINRTKLRKCLLKGTLFFEPALGLYAGLVVKSLDDQQ
jgi:hypothetical protein